MTRNLRELIKFQFMYKKNKSTYNEILSSQNLQNGVKFKFPILPWIRYQIIWFKRMIIFSSKVLHKGRLLRIWNKIGTFINDSDSDSDLS